MDPLMEGIVSKLIEKIVLTAPQIAVSLLLFVGFWGVAIIVERIIQRISKQSDRPRDVLLLVGGMAKIGILIFGAVTALGTMGINISALVAGLGLTGFALGFAFRDIISNVLAGVLILAYRPFRRSDHIGVTGLEGTVSEIDLRYTTLQAKDKRILIPNSTLFTNPISVLEEKTQVKKVKREGGRTPEERKNSISMDEI